MRNAALKYNRYWKSKAEMWSHLCSFYIHDGFHPQGERYLRGKVEGKILNLGNRSHLGDHW